MITYLLIGLGFAIGILLALLDEKNHWNNDKSHVFVFIAVIIVWLPLAIVFAYAINHKTRRAIERREEQKKTLQHKK